MLKQISDYIKEEIQISGYKFKKGVQAFLFNKKSGKIEFTIILGIKTVYEGYQFSRPSFYITFTEVEDIIEEALIANEIPPPQAKGLTIRHSYINIPEINEQFDFKINNDETLQQITNKPISIINLHGLPFFEKYDSLEKVAQLLAPLNEEAQLQYISGFSRYLKLPLVYKLANHPKYNICVNEFYKLMKEQSLNHHVEHVRKSFLEYIKVYEYLYRGDLNIQPGFIQKIGNTISEIKEL